MEQQYGVLMLEVNAEIEQQLKVLFDLETEMKQSKVDYLPDNKKRITVRVPRHKGKKIKAFMLRAIADFKRENLN